MSIVNPPISPRVEIAPGVVFGGGRRPFGLIAGPCVIESLELLPGDRYLGLADLRVARHSLCLQGQLR